VTTSSQPAGRTRFSSGEILGGFIFLAIGLAFLFAMQRESLPVLLRIPAGVFALIVLFWTFIYFLTDVVPNVLAVAVSLLVIMGTIGVGIASFTPSWASVPTSGASHRDAVQRDNPPLSNYTPFPPAPAPPASQPMHDPQNSNSAWEPCKAQLGLSGISDYALSNEQEVAIVACAVNANISNGG
jgi:hypothetical protein